MIGEQAASRPRVAHNTSPQRALQVDDLYPDLAFTTRRLGVQETYGLPQVIDKTYRWFAAPPRAK